MPSLIKHNSYRFENEIRFVLLRNKPINDRKGIKLFLTKSLNPIEDEIEIIAHPKMKEEKYKYYREKFEECKFNFKASSILSRDSVQFLLS
ncbi:hypothetical protein BH10BAC2_BH10BAC2_01580 [soil metagenome]